MISTYPWLAALAGLLLGSFLNVCIARLPRHRSIVWPGSHCPHCRAPIRAWDNIPLLSFVLLGGRCRICGGPISPRYPLVEAGLACLFVLADWTFPPIGEFLRAAALCFLLLGLSVMDAETFTLPDLFTLPGIALGIAQSAMPRPSLAVALALLHRAPFAVPRWPSLVSSLAGASLLAALLLLTRRLYWLVRRREGMGLGDVKLAALLGAWLGVAGALLSLALAVLLGASAGVFLLARNRDRTAGQLQLPFGSFLAAGGLFTLFLGSRLLNWYFHFWP